jgi:hypothetical protein
MLKGDFNGGSRSKRARGVPCKRQRGCWHLGGFRGLQNSLEIEVAFFLFWPPEARGKNDIPLLYENLALWRQVNVPDRVRELSATRSTCSTLGQGPPGTTSPSGYYKYRVAGTRNSRSTDVAVNDKCPAKQGHATKHSTGDASRLRQASLHC